MKQLQSVAAMGLVLLVAGPTMAQDLLWVEQFGTPYTDTATATAVDAADHVYVAGITHGALAPDVSERPRCQQAFLEKRDADGNVIWTRQFGSDWADTLRSVVVDADGNVLVTGLTVEIPFHLGSCNGPSACQLSARPHAGSVPSSVRSDGSSAIQQVLAHAASAKKWHSAPLRWRLAAGQRSRGWPPPAPSDPLGQTEWPGQESRSCRSAP